MKKFISKVMDDYISKLFYPVDLYEKLNEFLSRRKTVKNFAVLKIRITFAALFKIPP